MADQPTRPNILIIFTDDQGYADLGCFGSTTHDTPGMDALTAQGTKYTSFYAQAVCGPSRSALLTGRYPIRSGGWGMPADGKEKGERKRGKKKGKEKGERKRGKKKGKEKGERKRGKKKGRESFYGGITPLMSRRSQADITEDVVAGLMDESEGEGEGEGEG